MSQRPPLTPHSVEDVVRRIARADREASNAAARRQGRLTKPPGSLGRLEELSVQLAGVFGTARPRLRGKTVVVAAGDHGVVAQGVTAYPQEVTAQMVRNILAGGAAISVMARMAGVGLVVVDAGVAAQLPDHPDLRVVGAGRGTADITQGPAMTRGQAEACVTAGVALALEAAESGADLIGTGDMGIGNTTASSAVAVALTGRPPKETTGRGTGRNERDLEHKVAVVERALAVNRPDPADGLDVLARVGGFEIGVLAGVVLGGALAHRVVVLDGFISGAAALVAHSLCPTVRDYLVAAHVSAEAGHRAVLSHLRLRPLLDLDMRLGEGTGAVLAIGFLTVLPVSPGAVARMGPARAYFPLVGLGIGGVLAGLDFAAGQVLPPYVVGALLVAALLILTRAIHTEGFLDCCDGLLGAHTPERRLQVLRDPHVGAFAVAGGAALLLLKWSLLTGVPNEVRAALLALFPSLSRFGMVTTMAAFTYVRESGAGTAFQAGAHWRQVVFGLATAAAAGALLLGLAGLLLLGAAIAVALGVGWWVTRLLGGMTGDAYGAVNEIAEVTVLLLAIALLSPLRSLFEAPLW